jgi:predicted aspartyl protease
VLTFFFGPAQGQTGQRPPAVEVIPLDLSGPRPLAMLSIGSEAAVPVIFDTGASSNVLDAEYAQSVHLPNQGSAVSTSPAGGGAQEGFRTTIAQGRLGGAVLRHVSAVVLPLGLPRARGVFSPNSFSGRLVFVDFTHEQIRITDRNSPQLPVTGGSPYSDGPNGLPGIGVEIAGTTYDGHIDTGSNAALSLPRRLADQVPLESPLHVVGRARLPGGEEREIMGATIRGTVRIGPLTLLNPNVVFLEGLQRINVGMGVLRGVTIVLDPAGRRSWLVRQ